MTYWARRSKDPDRVVTFRALSRIHATIESTMIHFSDQRTPTHAHRSFVLAKSHLSRSMAATSCHPIIGHTNHSPRSASLLVQRWPRRASRTNIKYSFLFRKQLHPTTRRLQQQCGARIVEMHEYLDNRRRVTLSVLCCARKFPRKQAQDVRGTARAFPAEEQMPNYFHRGRRKDAEGFSSVRTRHASDRSLLRRR